MKIDSVCFDMDGTLIRNTDSVKYLCELNGHLEALEAIQELEHNNAVSWMEADQLKAHLIEGLELARVEREFDHSIHLIHNIEHVLAYLRARRICAVLITAGPAQVAGILDKKFGFDSVYGSQYEVKDGTFTGRIVYHLGSSGKLDCLQEFCVKNGFALEHCVAIGDSESDIEIFKACGRSIAINSSDGLVKVASEFITTNDLADILDLIEAWLIE